MDNEIPQELKEARQMLKEAIEAKTHEAKLSKFNNGIRMLKDYLEDKPDSAFNQWITNITTSYTRGILKQAVEYIRQGRLNDLSMWFPYASMFYEMRDVIEEIINKDDELENKYREFIRLATRNKIKEIKDFYKALGDLRTALGVAD